MKKLCFLLLFLCGLQLQAQKQYVTICCNVSGYQDSGYSQFYIFGDISDDIIVKANKLKSVPSQTGTAYVDDCRKKNNYVNIQRANLADVLSLFGDEGFEIDQSQISGTAALFIMSRAKSSETSNILKLRKGDVNEDEQVDISDVVSVINIIAEN